jgi:hypothetical protein
MTPQSPQQYGWSTFGAGTKAAAVVTIVVVVSALLASACSNAVLTGGDRWAAAVYDMKGPVRDYQAAEAAGNVRAELDAKTRIARVCLDLRDNMPTSGDPKAAQIVRDECAAVGAPLP